MNVKRIRRVLLVVLTLIFLVTQGSLALITGGRGDSPVEDERWPVGSAALANLMGRLGYWEGPPFGGGEFQFLYRCRDAEEFNEALKIFAGIKAPRLEVVVHNGPEYSYWLKSDKGVLEDANNRVDWTFTVWNPDNWNRLYSEPNNAFMSISPNFRRPVAPPRIDVYIGGGAIVWHDVKIPENVVVIDKRPASVSPEFADGGLVRGKVFDIATGKPIAGAEVALVTHENQAHLEHVLSGTTDNHGLCQIAKIPAGHYEVRISAKGYVSRKQGYYDNKRPEHYQFEVGLARPSYVKGIVTNVDGKQIEGVKVTAINVLGTDGLAYWCVSDVSAITDKQGRFEMQPLPPGLVNIRCKAEGLHVKNSLFEQYVIPSDEIKLIVGRTGIIRGKVVTKDGKRPSGQIVLEVQPPGENRIGKWSCSGYLAEDGTFDINGIPPGEYIISTRPNPSNSNYKPNNQKITVEPGQTCQVEVIHAEQ